MTAFWENIQVDGSTMDVHLSLPEGTGPFPAILLNHHGGGVDRFNKDAAELSWPLTLGFFNTHLRTGGA